MCEALGSIPSTAKNKRKNFLHPKKNGSDVALQT
jgi:hypothetical protein